MNPKKFAAFAVGPISAAALGFITLPIITWFFPADDIGRIAMMQAMSSFCVLVFSLGLDQAYVREYHETEHKPALLKAALLPGFVFLVVGLSLCLVVPSAISKILFSVENTSISLMAAICFLAAFVSRFLSLILRMQEKGLAYSMSQATPKLLFLVIIGVYVISSFGFDFFHLIVAHTLSIVAVMVVYAWNTRKEWHSAFREKLDMVRLKAMLRFGAPLILGGAAFWALNTMDKLFLRSFSTFDELGIYSVASNFAAAAVIFQNIFSTIWAPTVYKWASEGINKDRIDQVTEHVLSAIVFIFTLVALFSWLVTYLLPEGYRQVQYILVACVAGPLFYTISETTVVGLGITRRSDYALIASLGAALANFVGNYFLVPAYGAMGAAVSTSFAFWIFFILRTEFSCLVWQKIRRVKLYSATLSCLVAAIATAVLEGNYPWFMFAVWIVIGGAGVVMFGGSLRAAKLYIHSCIGSDGGSFK